MSKGKRQAGAPSMSATESKATYAELDQAHGHCLSLIATCTELGKDIRDTQLMGFVSDMPRLVTASQEVGSRVQTLYSELQVVRARDTKVRGKRIGPDNVMLVLSVGQDYEAWMRRFSNAVTPHMDTAYELINEARAKLSETTGSTA